MKPRYTLTLTDHKLNKEMTIGVEEFGNFRNKTIGGRSAVYELLDRFEDEVGQTSSNPTE